jgi:hypothetical protein
MQADVDVAGGGVSVAGLKLDVPQDPVASEYQVISRVINLGPKYLDVSAALAPEALQQFPNEDVLQRSRSSDFATTTGTWWEQESDFRVRRPGLFAPKQKRERDRQPRSVSDNLREARLIIARTGEGRAPPRRLACGSAGRSKCPPINSGKRRNGWMPANQWSTSPAPSASTVRRSTACRRRNGSHSLKPWARERQQ